MKTAACLFASLALASPALAQDAESIREELFAFDQPSLWFGDRAPELEIRTWVQGDPVSEFEPGHVYVVEFWATWCGPCIAGFPHLTKLQEQYADEVTIIGVDIWERFKSDEEQDTKVAAFVENQGERMGYTIAIDAGSMVTNYMNASGTNGIPAAFIVNGEGQIAWAGHPNSMDAPLEQIVSGSYDLAAAEATARRARSFELATKRVVSSYRAGEEDAQKMAQMVLADSEESTFWFRLALIEQLANPKDFETDTGFVVSAAQDFVQNAEATMGTTPSMAISVLAAAQFNAGMVREAVRTQKLAIERETNPGYKSWYGSTLEKYEAALND